MTGGVAKGMSPAELKPGGRMPDGTIYAGISPDTGRPMYTTPKDERVTFFLGSREPKLIFTFSEALKHASKLKGYGHKDWRVPTKSELNVLFNNRAAIGGFIEIDHFDYGPYYWDRLTMNAPRRVDAWDSQSYWSSSEDEWGGYGQRFSDGRFFNEDKGCHCSLRCVRG